MIKAPIAAIYLSIAPDCHYAKDLNFEGAKKCEDESTKIAFGNLLSSQVKLHKSEAVIQPEFLGTFDEFKIVNIAIDEAVEQLLNKAAEKFMIVKLSATARDV
ncbi:hypothetical protein ACJX0J_036919, partial [Zea mays]